MGLMIMTTAALAGQVGLWRSDPGQTQARLVPVTIGVPFAVDALKDERQVWLADAQGRPVALQTLVTSRWWSRGNSVQTLLCTWLADPQQQKYVLHYAEAPKPAAKGPRVTVKQEGQTARVDTGSVSVTLGGDCGFIQQLAYDANGNGKTEASETLIGPAKPAMMRCGEYSSAGGLEQLTVEESGPVRVVVRLQGHHRKADGSRSVAFDVRVRMYAGQPTMQIEHTFLQDTQEIFHDLAFVSVDLPLGPLSGRSASGARPLQTTFGLESGQTAEGKGDCTLLQVGPDQKEGINTDNGRAEFVKLLEERKAWWSEEEKRRWSGEQEIKAWATTLTSEGKAEKVGERAPGWVKVQPAAGSWSLTAALRDFWQLHPKAYAVQGDTLRLFLVPQMPRPLHMHIGMAKTHRLLLAFDKPAGGDAEARRLAFMQPPLYLPSADWYCASKVWGDVLPRKPGRYTLYESEVEREIRGGYLNRAEGANAYGMLNWGDIGGGNSYMNLETAYDHGMAVQFIRTGDRAVWDGLERAINHFRDVDVQQAKIPGPWDWGLWIMPGYMPEKLARECATNDKLRDEIFYWTGTQPPELGGVHRHSYMHFANAAFTPVPSDSRYPEKRMKQYSGSCDVGGHGWIAGLVDHYLLTGDRRSLEVAELAGQWVLKHGGTHWGRDNWKNIDLAWLYRATGKQEYLDRLMEALDVIYADKESTVERIAEQDKTLMSPYYTILQFIKHVHQLTGDEGVKAKFLDLVTRWIDHVPSVETAMGPVFQYIREYKDSRCHTDFADLAYAYLLTGDRKYLEKSLNTADFYLHFAYHSTAFFSIPEYLYALDKAKIEAFNDPPPAIRQAKAFWMDGTDRPVKLVVYQQSGYRVGSQDVQGTITITLPSGKETITPITRSSLEVYRITVPADGEKGIYSVKAEAPGCSYGLGSDAPLTSGPPPVLAAGKFGQGVRLADGAKLLIPAKGHLNLDEGTVELWFQPLWNAPSGRTAAVPYHYHQIFDSRDKEYDYGFMLWLYDGGEVNAGKSLMAGWAARDKSDSVGLSVQWQQGDWHHLAFAWKRTSEATGVLKLYLDGALVGEKQDAGSFPPRLSDLITCGTNPPESPNTHMNGVLDELRILKVMREPTLGPLTLDADTLLLKHFDTEADLRQ
jgi:hypothetical protein